MIRRRRLKPDYDDIARLEHNLGLDNDGLVDDVLQENVPPPPPPAPKREWKSQRQVVEEATRGLEWVMQRGNFTGVMGSSSYGPTNFVQVQGDPYGRAAHKRKIEHAAFFGS